MVYGPLEHELAEPSVECPFCGAVGPSGEAPCHHWFASRGPGELVVGRAPNADAADELWVEFSVRPERERAQILRIAPSEIANVILAVDPAWGDWWEEWPGVEEILAEDDQGESDGYEVDYFHPDPAFPEYADALVARALAWLRLYDGP